MMWKDKVGEPTKMTAFYPAVLLRDKKKKYRLGSSLLGQLPSLRTAQRHGSVTRALRSNRT